MNPFTLEAVCKDYLWGGTRLLCWNNRPKTGRVAEAWELAAHPNGDCAVLGGPCAGMTLSQVVAACPEIVSPRHSAGALFPVIVKLIDTKLPLSIQAHPDDAYAARFEGGPGKSEMWYIIDHELGASVRLGFLRETTRGEVERAVADGTLPDLLRKIEVREGDCLFIPAGTVHAIGGGILLAEVQQSSNLTYRLFDYNRVGPDGRPRTLHLKKALDVARMGPASLEVPGASPERSIRGGSWRGLVDCPQFRTGLLRLDGAWEGEPEGSFLSLLCLEGSAELRAETTLNAQRGTSLFVPADAGPFVLEGRGEFLVSSAP